MASEMGEAIRQLMQEKGLSEDSVKLTIENMLKAAYKRTFGTADNAAVQFADHSGDTVYQALNDVSSDGGELTWQTGNGGNSSAGKFAHFAPDGADHFAAPGRHLTDSALNSAINFPRELF